MPRGAGHQGHTLLHQVEKWLEDGNSITASSVAWTEFCNGPLTPECYEHAMMLVAGLVLPFDRAMAERAARLFNMGGRRRGSHSDCMVAACALISDAPLSTLNTKDFSRFVPFGLRLHKF